MNKSIIWHLAAGWMGVMGWVSTGQAMLADEPGTAPQITVYVFNWAEVELGTLQEAKNVATRVFRNGGLDATLLDPPSPADEGEGQTAEEVTSTTFIVHVVPPAMAKRFGLPASMLGVAPGTAKEKNRTTVYVFDQVAANMAREHREQVQARVNGAGSHPVEKGQVLGHAIAHEIGHVLLHQDSHSRMGLMRAGWDRNDLQNIVSIKLLFMPEEAERVRAEVRRRSSADIGRNPGL